MKLLFDENLSRKLVRETRSGYCGARPSGSRNSRRIPNSQSSFLTATDAFGADRCEVTSGLI